MINKVCEFLSVFPLISGRTIHINHLDDRPGSLSLENVSSVYTVKEYTDGERLCAIQFIFASREVFSLSKSASLETTEFYGALCEWLEKQSAEGILPVPGKHRTAVSLLPVGSYFLKSTSGSAARYELRLELRYRERR